MNIRQRRALSDFLDALDAGIQRDAETPLSSNARWWVMGCIVGIFFLAALTWS